MAHFQSFLDTPAFIPPDEELSFADCELYPSEIDPYTKNRTSNLRQQLSWIEDSAKGYYFQPPYTSDAHCTNEPFSTYNADGHWSDINMNLRPAARSVAYSHSDQFPSPWTGHPSSPSGLDSPRSSSWGNNIGCYMSPPYTEDDAMIPPEDYRYPSPGELASSVALPEVKIQQDHECVVLFEPDVPALPLDDVEGDIEQEDIGLIPSVSGETPVIDEDLFQDHHLSRPPPPRNHLKNNKPSSPTNGVQKRKSTLRNRPTRTTPPRRSAPASTQIKQRGKPKVARGRQFVCSFAHYGCACTFSSKNEWKRHVTTQHLQLGYYRCDLADCNVHKRSGSDHHHHQHHKKSRSSSHHDHHHSADLVANDFNRKDLFTQHLRRMHAPWHKDNRTNPSTGEREVFERSLDAVRDRCWHSRRQPPTVSQCGFCGQDFHGKHSWDDRMEHVGRHYERDNPQPGAEAEDIKLRKWAVDEGIVRFVGGTWALTSLCEE